MVSSTNVWAVGVRRGFSSNRTTLIEHWDGHGWRVIAAPSPRNSSLNAVAAASGNHVWAVGERIAAGRVRPLVLHWDRTAWRIIRMPAIEASLLGVAVISPNDVWAVGNKLSRSGDISGVALHWNGRRWSRSRTEHDEPLRAVAGASANDVWAVGVTNDAYAEPFKPALWRWTGRWSKFARPTVRGNAELLDIAFEGRARGWAVGTGDTLGTVSLRWNGRLWTRVDSPRDPRYYSAFGAVTALRNGRAWAAGSVCTDYPSHVPEEPYHGDYDCESRPLAARWDGRRWRVTPIRAGLTGRLFDIDAPSADALWAVGYRGFNNRIVPLVLHWNG